MKPVALEIRNQGAPIVNHGYVHAGGGDCVAIYVDMRSKRCEILSYGADDDCPLIDIWATEGSLHLDESKPREELTSVAFPEYMGWRVFSASIGRYTLSVCLVRAAAAAARKEGT